MRVPHTLSFSQQRQHTWMRVGRTQGPCGACLSAAAAQEEREQPWLGILQSGLESNRPWLRREAESNVWNEGTEWQTSSSERSISALVWRLTRGPKPGGVTRRRTSGFRGSRERHPQRAAVPDSQPAVWQWQQQGEAPLSQGGQPQRRHGDLSRRECVQAQAQAKRGERVSQWQNGQKRMVLWVYRRGPWPQRGLR